MSHRKDTDYLSISARIRAMENRLLTRERMDRMIDARDTSEAMKVLGECGYGEGASLDAVLAQARADTFRDMEAAAPDHRLVEIFQLKYDYHNAKAILKAQAMGVPAERLLLPGGRYDGKELLEGWQREDLRGCSETFRKAMDRAKAALAESRDPQQADVILDRACYEEMARLARELESDFLMGYVRLSVDVANLRTAIRVHRMGKEGDFLRQVLLPGGSVSEQTVAAARGEALGEVFRSGPLAQAAELGAKLTQPGSGALTAFEKACDDAVTAYLSAARRVPFGEQTVVGYLYARELELTAIRTIFAGRAAGLDGDTIRSRLRGTYV
ncbi:V-type ATPase subunit [Pseudoflavonifractor phocaeensis]|uniref:V-type ATPase subunit n=1 Tax=Pseudoflavonifractor phocaeensis TaxID=1870988 RepID=UPI001F216500|nr:V-type ATPase subunit [Pseudoflavonifractor phocaeensis]MCF2595053.1 V-type ATPase subunit [Pseudoflavonifractor phocaeensis]